MNFISFIGYSAAFLTTIGFVPQFIKVVRTKKTKDISLWMYIILITGIFLWLTYGLIKNDWPIIIANIVTLILVIPILIYKMIFK